MQGSLRWFVVCVAVGGCAPAGRTAPATECDRCDVCDEDPSNDCRPDCAGTFGGSAVADMCGTCDADPENDCLEDCAGSWGGTAHLDACGDCVGGTTGLPDCGIDCAGTPGGAAYADNCGTCDTDAGNDCVQDCSLTWGGTAVTDHCGTCDADPENDCSQDCNDEWGGSALVDECGECAGGTTGLVACVQDCNGEWGGAAYVDDCAACVGGATGAIACVQDCAGTWGGTALSDNCGTCDTNPGNDCTQDCDGEWGGTAYLDECGECVGGTTGETACPQDCNGVWGGTAFVDECDTCVGGDTGLDACVQDCAGEWGGAAVLDQCEVCDADPGNDCVQDCAYEWGGTAVIDDCGDCVGGTTGAEACAADCNGVAGGVAYIDACGECVGEGTGSLPCRADCAGVPGGLAFVDACDACVGGTTGATACTSCDVCGVCDRLPANDCTRDEVDAAEAAYLDSADPDDPKSLFGGNLYVYPTGIDTLVKYDLSVVSNGVAVSARLNLRGYGLTHYDGADSRIEAALVPSDTWSRSTVTWNNAPASAGQVLSWFPELGQDTPESAALSNAVVSQAAGDGFFSLRLSSSNVAWASYNDVYYAPGLVLDQVPLDCLGDGGGLATVDHCDTCDADPGNDCRPDCRGVWAGEYDLDACGYCAHPADRCRPACDGEAGSPAYADACAVCDAEPSNDCAVGCDGVPGSAASYDACGACDDVADNDCLADTVTDSFADTSLIDPARLIAAVVGGEVRLPSGISTGRGTDGACVVASTVNLSTASCSGRAFPDAPAASLDGEHQAGTQTLTLTGPLAGLLPGDELLVLVAKAGTLDRIGQHELVRVTSVAGSSAGVAEPLVHTYRAADLVVVQRVPHYTTVTVNAAGTLTASGWNGAAGGVLALRATGAITVHGALSMDGKGLRGGQRPTASSANGNFGESVLVAPAAGADIDRYGGGLGRGEACLGFGAAGGGGGHATTGEAPASCVLAGGEAYPDDSLRRLAMGAGGGSGGNDDSLADNPRGGAGGRGGGVVFLAAASIEVGASGSISARGQGGQGDSDVGGCSPTDTDLCWDFSGAGGGGGGGAVLLYADTLTLLGSVSAEGGAGGLGQQAATTGGAGGVGYVGVLDRATVSGSTSPASTVRTDVPLYGTSGVVYSASLSLGAPIAFQYSLVLERGTAAWLELSPDGTTWFGPSGTLDSPAPLSAGTHSLDLGGLAWTGDTYYRVWLYGTTATTPHLLEVALSHTP